MITRRTLLKFFALVPLVGPAIAKAVIKAETKPSLVRGPYLPAWFPKWDRAVDGLESAGKWSVEIKRSWLPCGMVVPRVGQIWETLQECEVAFRPCFAHGQTEIGAAGKMRYDPVLFRFLVGGKTRLQSGEAIRIIGLDDNEKPLRVSFHPLRYVELHAQNVPEDIRRVPGYEGYELSVKSAKTIADFGKEDCRTYFNEAFRLVEDLT
jgi:hypothetical protein